MKTYTAHVQFNAIGITVRALSAKSARKRIRRKIASRNILRLIDRQNFFVESSPC